MPRTRLGNFSVDLPPDWADITAGVAGEDPPLSLARRDGVGALQFSVARYQSGPRPAGDVEELQELLDDFAAARSLGPARDAVREHTPHPLVAASFDPGGDFLRVWYTSDRGSFAVVTYICERPLLKPAELAEAEAIVRTIAVGAGGE